MCYFPSLNCNVGLCQHTQHGQKSIGFLGTPISIFANRKSQVSIHPCLSLTHSPGPPRKRPETFFLRFRRFTGLADALCWNGGEVYKLGQMLSHPAFVLASALDFLPRARQFRLFSYWYILTSPLYYLYISGVNMRTKHHFIF